MHPCSHYCHNSPGSFSCSCNPGYSLERNGHTCKDIDECDNNNGGCDLDNECINIDGSFICAVMCKDGYRRSGDGQRCIGQCLSLTCASIDFTKLNESVKRENYPLPAVKESLANARMFTKLDANSSFWQTNLAEESRPLTTFITPFGRYCCNRLPFGINSQSANEFFQKRMSETVEGYPGVLCHMDDVLVFGASQEEHDERLEKILEAIGKADLTLNEKCEFSKPSVKFLGQIVDASGCRVDPDKVYAIAEMTKPTDISGVRYLNILTLDQYFKLIQGVNTDDVLWE
ncbi:Hypothetical predicted protein [Mytilus galloprovincialis]|uniref:Reverse transcriptase domain-containing protein n=1 Tax=Mytilus galloprovincialis TaxID=29158 RepID=A0A8B6H8N2_MYTGA|nr:Hypothetical predicted protein [Mytilus galloprovincialis]